MKVSKGLKEIAKSCAVFWIGTACLCIGVKTYFDTLNK